MVRIIIYFIIKFYYLPWSKLYQWLEKKLTSNYDYKRQQAIAVIDNLKLKYSNPFMRYYFLWKKEFPDIVWRSDKWYMLWDVIRDPYMLLLTGDDCDTFALLSYHVLGKNLVHKDKDYQFKGLWSFIYFKWGFIPGGHFMGIWKTSDGEIIASSNRDLFYFSSWDKLLEWYDTEKIKYVIKITSDLKLISVDEVVYGKK